jgi:hypothetical protein
VETRVSPSDFVLFPSGAMASLRQKENFTGLHTELNRRCWVDENAVKRLAEVRAVSP